MPANQKTSSTDRAIILLLSTFLTACAAITPAYVAELGTCEFARYEDLKSKLLNR
ncbi:hypothetical protein [Sansalvadorimonas verongulae]|uniref:hypothetical protein n=1 Tax=Sansalvadorimonas verongulae TaxID=2172824 RepID=UPI0012BB8357|nr:hypothetical protein [Sansalvadorimonas verongulae]